MAKCGRKRKPGPRTKAGQHSRAGQPSQRDHVLAQPHRRGLPENKRGDQRAESVLGRLYLAGHITEPECWAGEKWRRLMHDFHVVLATPVQAASAISAMVAPGVEHSAEADHLAAETPETDEEKRERVMDAFDVVCGRLDSISLCALDAVVIQDRPPGPDALPELRVALGQLARLWRLGDNDHRPIVAWRAAS